MHDARSHGICRVLSGVLFGDCWRVASEGQGYVWMNHRSPASKTWGLAHRGKLLWEQLVADLTKSGSDPRSVIGWQNTGLLLSRL